MDKNLGFSLISQGYQFLQETPNRGVCGLGRMAYTIGLFYGMDEEVYIGRYCFHTWAEAKEALIAWDGIGHPSGNWIKHKVTGWKTLGILTMI